MTSKWELHLSILLFYLIIERWFVKLHSFINLLFCQGDFWQIFAEIVSLDVFHLYFFALLGILDIMVLDSILISFFNLNTFEKYYKFLIHNYSIPPISIPILIPLHQYHSYLSFAHLKNFSLLLPYHFQSYDYKNGMNLGILFSYLCFFYLFFLLYLHLSPNQIDFMIYLAIIHKNLLNSYLFDKLDLGLQYFVNLRLEFFIYFFDLISLMSHNTLIILLILHCYDSWSLDLNSGSS